RKPTPPSIPYTTLFRSEAGLAAEQDTQALALFRGHRPPDHPETLGSMSSLASSYEALNRHAEALKLREEVLAVQKRTQPPDDTRSEEHTSELQSRVDLV